MLSDLSICRALIARKTPIILAEGGQTLLNPCIRCDVYSQSRHSSRQQGSMRGVFFCVQKRREYLQAKRWSLGRPVHQGAFCWREGEIRFQFSIWSGVLLLVVALALLLISSADGTTQQTVYVMLVIAAILALLTIYNDIRLAGVAWGGLAVLLQIIFALSFVFLIIFALIGFVMKKLFNIHSSLLASIFGGLGIKGELLLLLHFLHL